MFKEPDGEDSEREEHDEDEQVGAVLPVALLGDSLRGDVVHGAVLRSAAARHHQQSPQQERQRQRLRRPGGTTTSRWKFHGGCPKVGYICRSLVLKGETANSSTRSARDDSLQLLPERRSKHSDFRPLSK